ncbi:carboxypeptidase regulatory-like domain-containing protein [Cohnella cellulosilytica]|uniref:Carboxypeptidase regulatory-like domain-containing protein n=1 Tax=Cohnella cellulosilytica TaxID=986710 RepID=A0ABW2FBY8_9BACL
MPFPSDSQYVPLSLTALPSAGEAGSANPAYVDVVGTPSSPAAYYGYDGINVYFRIRLKGDPRFKSVFRNAYWGVLFDTDGLLSAYEWLLRVNGTDHSVELVRNNASRGTGIAALAAIANGTSAAGSRTAIVNFDIARAKPADDRPGLRGDYFIDFYVNAGVLFGELGLGAASPLRLLFFSAETENGAGSDLPVSGTGALSNEVAISGGNVRAELSVAQTLNGAPFPQDLPAGPQLALSGTIQVANTGRSAATALFANTLFQIDRTLVSFTIDSVSAGSATFTSSNLTLSWTVGNLEPGSTAELRYTAQVIFAGAGNRIFNTTRVRGVDSFTGNQLAELLDIRSVNIVQVRLAGLSGRIQSRATGMSVPGAQIELISGGRTTAGAASNGSGYYSFTGIVPGSYALTVSAPLFQTATADVTLANGEVAMRNVQLVPLPSGLQGTVTASDTGQPIAGVSVQLSDVVEVTAAGATSDASGLYRLTDVTPGTYRVSFSAPGFQHNDQPVTLEPGAVRTLNVALAPNPGTVSGTISDTFGNPVAGALAEALDDRINLIALTNADDFGVYAISSLSPASDYRLRVTAPNYATALLGFSVAAGRVTTVDVALAPLPGSIAGSVTDSSTGGPIEDACVRVYNSAGLTIQTARTDGNGRYEVGSLAPGAYNVLFNDTGYANRTVGAFVRANEQTTLDVALDLLSGSLEGAVRSSGAGGEPIPDALVRVYANNLVVARASTDENGRYSVTSLAPRSYILTARATGFGGQTLGAVIVAAATATVDFSLQPEPGSLVGTLTDTNGNPVPGAAVALMNDLAGGPAVVARVVSGDDGAYSVDDLEPGNYAICVTAEGYRNAVAGVIIRPGRESNQSFVLLAAPGSLSGTITDTLGVPLAGAEVEIRQSAIGGTSVSSQFADAAGRFIVDNLMPGSYTLFASLVGYRTNTIIATVRAGAVTEVGIMLAALPGAIEGRITDETTGAPLPGAFARALNQTGLQPATAVSDSEGRYRMDGLVPGNYTVVAQARFYQSRSIGAIVEADATTPIDLALAELPGSIAGTVSLPLPGVLIELYNRANLPLSSTYTDSAGRFRFDNLQVGSYVLTGSFADYTLDTAGVTVRPEQESEVLLTLTPNPAAVSGRVVDPAGSPLAGASVRLIDPGETPRAVGQTDAEGRFAVGGLPVGVLIAVVSAPGYSTVTVSLRLSPGLMVEGLLFTLQPNPGGITGTIRDADTGEAIAGAAVEARQSDASGVAIAVVATSPSGNYMFEGLRPGTYAIVVSAAEYVTASIGAIVASGETTDGSLTLEKQAGGIEGSITVRGSERLAGASIFIRVFTSGGTLVVTLFAGDDGRFEAGGLKPGVYSVTVSAIDYEATAQTAVVLPGQVKRLAFELIPSRAALLGRVVDEATGTGIDGALIKVNRRERLPLLTAVSDAAGEFAITSLPIGVFTLTASAQGFGAVSVGFATKAGQTERVTLRLASLPGTVFGFVSRFDNGANLPGAEIRLYNGAGVLVATVLSDSDGSYAYGLLKPGEHTAVAAADGFASANGGFVAAAGQSTRFSFSLQPLPGTLSGRVARSEDGASLAGALVALRLFNNFGEILAQTSTAADGGYALEGLAAANYTVVVSLEGYVGQQTSVYVGPGGSVSLNVALARGLRRRGLRCDG